jgi:hypothetical protein
MMPITIQSNLTHILLQFGPDLDMADCSSICCAVDTCAALSPGNFHFFTAIAKRYPHCVAKLLAPANNAPIVLSEIVQTNDKAVTMELKVGFQFHLPYCTSGGNSSSLLMATDPNVLVNTIIGLPFIKATGMILDFVDNVAKCKHLDHPPFLIDYCGMSNHVPVTNMPEMPVHHFGPHEESILKELKNLEHWMDAMVLAGNSSSKNIAAHFGFKSPRRVYIPNMDSNSVATSSNSQIDTCWVPPTAVPSLYSDDYYQQILWEDGYL